MHYRGVSYDFKAEKGKNFMRCVMLRDVGLYDFFSLKPAVNPSSDDVFVRGEFDPLLGYACYRYLDDVYYVSYWKGCKKVYVDLGF